MGNADLLRRLREDAVARGLCMSCRARQPRAGVKTCDVCLDRKEVELNNLDVSSDFPSRNRQKRPSYLVPPPKRDAMRDSSCPGSLQMRRSPPQSSIQAMPAMSEDRSCQGATSSGLDPAIACQRRRERALHDLSNPPAASGGQDLRRLPGSREKGRAIASRPGWLQQVWRGPPWSVQTMPAVSEGSPRPRSAPTAAPDRRGAVYPARERASRARTRQMCELPRQACRHNTRTHTREK